MNKENVLLSYPRSGNHLCRFFIELLSEIPTFGCKDNCKDIELFKNTYTDIIPFNIKTNYDINYCFYKYHTINKNNNVNDLILIIRNPLEIFARFYENLDTKLFDTYFDNIDYFNNFNGNKLLLYYEDIITDKIDFINKLYDFLNINNIDKKNYVINNIDSLFSLCSKGSNRQWGGINSNFNIQFYYSKLSIDNKKDLDNYLKYKLINYKFIIDKYNITFV
tara:strand:- start:609 stop:1271 length:663 start_codon:yes stop_codon:yes gene_type:complete